MIINLIDTEFTIIEVYKSGARVTHLFRGRRKDVMKDVENWKRHFGDYMMVSKKVMIVWA